MIRYKLRFSQTIIEMSETDLWLLKLLPAATKLGQGNVFTSVCLSTGGRGVSASVHAGIPPKDQTPPGPGTHPPGPGTHPHRPDTPHPGADNPPGTDTHPPPGADPPDQAPPPDQTPPLPREADCSIRLTSGRYASYWNAFLFTIICSENKKTILI